MRALLVLSAVLLACSTATPDAATPMKAPAAVPTRTPAAVPAEATGVGYFAGGCFWGVEHYLEQMDGVASVESGYMGGAQDAPSYEEVSTGASGHLEAVRVRFDPAKVSYEQVAKRFFEIHDPTQADGQGPDIGSQYRSAVFYVDEEQRRVDEALIARLRARGYAVVTELRAAGTFWPAETYHQDYYAKTGKTPYCHTRVRRFGD
jgi:peptide methionine sulfoxide reductase msrA/msrB